MCKWFAPEEQGALYPSQGWNWQALGRWAQGAESRKSAQLDIQVSSISFEKIILSAFPLPTPIPWAELREIHYCLMSQYQILIKR